MKQRFSYTVRCGVMATLRNASTRRAQAFFYTVCSLFCALRCITLATAFLSLGTVFQAGCGDDPECDADSMSTLVLSPVKLAPTIFGSVWRSCAEVGVAEINVWVFKGERLVTRGVFDCQGGPIEVGRLCQGSYQLAATAFSETKGFVAGMSLLGDFYESYPTCHTTPYLFPCRTVLFGVFTLEPTVVPVHLTCDENLSPGTAEACLLL